MYKTGDIETTFNISHETVRAWAAEFAAYLSPTATPEKGRQRIFTEDDLLVFALVKTFRNEGKTYNEMHAALGAGQRGDLPDIPQSSNLPVQASAALTAALHRVADLEALLTAEHDARMKVEGQNELLKEQLREAHAEIARLQRNS